jgi:hypothetical protein
MLKFATFNILHTSYIHYNTGECKKSWPISYKDEHFRNSIILKLFYNNDFDIIYLQEVSPIFIELLIKSELKTKYEILSNNELVILCKKSIVSKIEEIDIDSYIDIKYNSYHFIKERLYGIKCNILNNPFLLINVHMPSSQLQIEKNDVIKIINNIVVYNLNNSQDYKVIIAGDMNTEKYLFSKMTNRYTMSSIFNSNFKKSNVTSFKLGKCKNNIFVALDHKFRHHFIDDIYVTQNINANNMKILSNYTDKFLLFNNKEINNSLKGDPYCDPKIYKETNVCNIDDTKNKFTNTFVKAHSNNNNVWPSDHYLVYAELNFDDAKTNNGSISNNDKIKEILMMISLLHLQKKILNIQ